MSVQARVRNARGEGSRLREELVDAASRLLSAGDPAALTLRAVAREAGVAAPSVYGHFEDLDDLLLAVVEHHLAGLRAAVEQAATAPHLDDDPARVRDALRSAAVAYCRWGTENAGAYAVVFGGRAVRLLSEAEQVAFTDGEAVLEHVGRLLRRLPEVPDAEVEGRVLALWTALHGLVSLRSGKPGYPWPALEAHVDLMVREALGPAVLR